MELAIDTSTEVAGIALSERGVAIEERIWNAGRNHTVELMPGVATLLERNGVSASDLQAIFVATGPGGFTAVRVGISAAKGLALGSGATLVGVGTMWIEAIPFAGRGLPVRPIMDAGRDELSVGRFANTDDGLAEVAPPALLTPDALIAETSEATLFLRPASGRHPGAARRSAGQPGTLPGPCRRVEAPLSSLRAGLGAPTAGRRSRRRERRADLREASRHLDSQAGQDGAPQAKIAEVAVAPQRLTGGPVE